MNKIIILVVIVLFQSCNDIKPEGNAIVEAQTTGLNPEKTFSVTIPSIDIESLQPLLHKNNDTIYIVNFWATWCKPCVKELPAFEKLKKQYESKKVKVLLVSLDFPKQLESKVIPFVENRKLKSQVVLLNDPDANTWIPKVDTTWTGAIPATLIYNRENRNFYERSFTYEELENKLKILLK